MHRCIVRLLLALSLVPAAHAGSTLQAAASTGGPVTASAQLNFRITVEPTLALSTRGTGMRIQGNSGVLTLQRGPDAGVQLHPRHGVVDTSIGAPNGLVTIASP